MKKRFLSILLTFGIVMSAWTGAIGVSAEEAVYTETASILGSGKCSDTVSWQVDSEGVLKVYGTGVMPDYSSETAMPWYGYISKVKEIEIGEGITYVGQNAFYGFSNATNITIPSTVEEIGQYAFKLCTSIEEVILPEGLTKIGSVAFHGCTGIKHILIPSTLQTIGNVAFSDCRNLEKLEWNAVSAGDVAYANYIFSRAGKDSGNLEVIFGDTVEYIPNYLFFPNDNYETNITSVKFGSGLKKIGEYAFKSCADIESVILPEGLTEIGSMAFHGCTGIKNISIPSTLKTINNHAFGGCEYLEKLEWNAVSADDVAYDNYIFSKAGKNSENFEVIIGDEVEYIPASIFYPKTNYETNIKSVKFGKNLKKIGKYAFKACENLESVILPEGLTEIGEQAFHGCSGIKNISIPSTLEVISNYAFTGCLSLEKLEWNAVNVPDFEASNYIFSKAGRNSGNLEVIFGDKVTHIPAKIFYPRAIENYNGAPAVKTVTMWNSVKSIGEYAFYIKILNDTTYEYPLEKINFYGSSSDWKAINVATGNTLLTNITPTYYTAEFTVKFVDHDGTELKTDIVKNGSDATEPEKPTRDGYTFVGWDVNFTNVKSNLTVTAQYDAIPTPATYTVKFVDYDETVLKTETVDAGGSATAPEDPTRDGHTFTGWDVKFDNVTSDLTVTAQYEEIKYTVKFTDYNGTVLKEEEVSAGGDATPPEVSDRTGYTFAGWDSGYTNIQEETVVTALYKGNEYTLSFDGGNDEEYETMSVIYGSLYGELPTPEKEGFVFAGWYTEAGVLITANTTVNTAESHTLTARWADPGSKYIKVSSELAKSGETVTLTVTADENINMAIGGMYIDYDRDTLSLEKCEFGEMLDNTSKTYNENKVVDEKTKLYVSFVGTENITAGGTLFSLTFKVNENAANDTIIPVAVEISQLYDADETVIAVNTTDGSVWIVNYEIGDVSQNGNIDLIDALRIMQYDVGLRTFNAAEKYLGDVNADGDVDIVDAFLIQKYDAGLMDKFE